MHETLVFRGINTTCYVCLYFFSFTSHLVEISMRSEVESDSSHIFINQVMILEVSGIIIEQIEVYFLIGVIRVIFGEFF